MTRRLALVLAFLIVAIAGVAATNRPERIVARESLAAFPMTVNTWRGAPTAPFSDDVLAVLGVDDYLTRVYTEAGQPGGVGLYIGYWNSQRQGDTIHSPLNCLPGAGWEPLAQNRIAVPDSRAAGATPASINHLIVMKGLERQLVLYWYQSHGRVVASEYWNKLYLISDAVRMNRSDGAIVRVTSPILGEGPAAIDVAERDAVRFVQDLMPHLSPFLPN